MVQCRRHEAFITSWLDSPHEEVKSNAYADSFIELARSFASKASANKIIRPIRVTNIITLLHMQVPLFVLVSTSRYGLQPRDIGCNLVSFRWNPYLGSAELRLTPPIHLH